ncbi:MAG: tRNA-binding protein [Candidatus Rokuibacteriota bacterium]
MDQITLEEFERVEMRVGRILQVEEFPTARKPSYRLTIDFGSSGVRRSSAAVQPFYLRDSLVGRQVVAVMNFPPRRIADFESEVLVLGAVEPGGRVILLQPDADAELGARIA